MPSLPTPTSYTPTVFQQGSSAPQYGQQDATGSTAIKDLQTSLNTANSGKNGYVPLVIDGKYGPKTQAATTFQPKSSLVVTSNPAKVQGSQDSSNLNNLLNKYGLSAPGTATPTTGANPNNTDTTTTDANDPYTSLLTQISNGSDQATKNLISGIQAAKQNNANKVDQQYDSYKRGLQLIGIQHNEATFSPDLLASHINQAEDEHQQKLQDLQTAETKAISDANQAKLTGNLSLLKDRMDYIRQIQQDKSTALKNYYDTVTNSSKVASAQIDPTSAQAMLDSMSTLDDADKENFIQAVATKFGLSPLAVVNSLSTIVSDKQAADLKTQNTNSIIAKRNQPKSTGTKTANATKEAAAEITQALKTGKDANGNVIGNAQGSDGFVDPQVYLKALTNWPGTQKEFLAKFPVKGTVNPESYDILPQSIQPVKSGRSA